MHAFAGSILAISQLFLLIGLGWLLTHKFSNLIGSPNGDFWNTVARFVYMVSVPVLVIDMFADFRWEISHLSFVAATIGSVLVLIVITLVSAKILPLTQTQRTIVSSISYHPNCVFLGFPLMMAVIGKEAMPLAALFAVVEFPLATIVAIWVLGSGHKNHPDGSQTINDALKRMARDPVVLACLIGVVISFVQVPIPSLIRQPMHWLGSIASPLALITIGARMRLRDVRADVSALTAVNGFKLVVAPLVAFMIAKMFSLGQFETAIMVLLLGTPVAMSTILLVEQHGGDSRLTANAITITTILSLITSSVTAAMVL